MPSVLLHPSYFPNIATMAVLAQHNICWELWDNYQKQTYRNRSYICTDQGRHMLSIPIQHRGNPEGRQLYKEVKVDNSYPWQRQHWRTLQTAYRASPFFEYFEEDLEPLFTKKYDSLLDFNLKTIEVACSLIDIPFPAAKTESYAMELADQTDGRFMINAKQEREYGFKSYPQVFQERHGFIPNTSILDLLFNEGNNSITYLENINTDWLNA